MHNAEVGRATKYHDAKEGHIITRYLITCRSNPSAPWPTDPEEYKRFIRQALAGFDAFIEQGLIKDIGFFLDGQLDGYVIVEGDGLEILSGGIAGSEPD